MMIPAPPVSPFATLLQQGKRFCLRFRQQIFILLLTVLCVLPLVVQARLGKPKPAASVSQPPAIQPQGTRIISSGQVKSRKLVKKARTAQGAVTSEAPQFTPEQLEEMERQMEQWEEREKANPLGPFPGASATYAPVVPSNDRPTPAPKAIKLAPTAPNDFVIKDAHDLTIAETSTLRENTHEPSLGSMGGTIFYTANRYAARSTDGGQTFSYVSPLTTFPSVNNGFCCDQVVNYAPAQNMIVWSLQYLPDANTGTLRIARAVGNQVANNFWVYYDFTPQDFAFPSGNYMDFPTMTISSTFLYVTSNVAQTAAGNQFTGSVVMRIPLTQLAAGGNITPQSVTFNDLFSPRCTEGATTTMYFAGLPSNSSIRIYRWDDASSTPSFDNVAVNAFTYLARDGVATSPDGTNWAANAQTKILAAWRSNGKLGFMWPAKQSGAARPYPYTIIAQFNESNRAFIGQQDIFSMTFAWLYPNVAVNAAGNLGGVIAYGGGALYPNTALFLIDDVTPNFDNPTVIGALSNAGPFDNAWGDYLTVRQQKTDINTFVAGIYRLNGSTVVPTYLRFGRERDFSVCSVSLAPMSASPGVGGGPGSVTVTTGESCNWTATSNASWLTILGGATGSGNGTVNYSVAANTGGARTGTLTIGGQTFSVMQAGCTYNINPSNQSFTTSGGAGTIGVTTLSGCVRTAQSNANWITITSGSSGTGNGTVSYSVAINNSATPRTGTITISGNTFTVMQSAANLATFAINPATGYFSNSGGSGAVGVTTANGNAWTAQTNNSWITINSGGSGTGSGTVNYAVAANNTGSARTGIITIATIPFVVTQGAPGTLLEADFNNGIPPGWTVVDGGTGGAAASTWTTGNPGGRLIDTPFASNFAIIDSDQAGDGNTQDEQLITPVFSATGFSQVVLEFNSQFLYLNNEIADVDVSTNGGVNWTNVLRMQGADDGFPAPNARTVNITGAIALNPASVQIRFRYYNASWAWWWAIDNVRVRCSYAITPTSQSFTEDAGSGSVNITTDAGCPWTAVSNVPWLTITSGSSGAGNGTANFSVMANPGPSTRTGTLTVAGDTVFVRQAAPGVPFETDFNSGLPPDWKVMNGGLGSGPTSTWTLANPCSRAISGTFNQSFAIMDTGTNCPRTTQASTPNEELMSPVINATDAGQVLLEFSNQFRLQDPGMDQTGDVEVSTDNGATWTNVLRIQGGNDGFPSANLKTIDITSAIAANPANARIRFRYYGSSSQGAPRSGKRPGKGPNGPTTGAELWWAVDELKLCKYKIVPVSQNYPLAGGSGSVQIITGPLCKWSATSVVPWATLGATTSGVGSGTISYTVAANNTGSPRTGLINIAGQSSLGQTIAGQTFTINQAGCPAITVNPASLPGGAINAGYSQPITASGGTGPYAFTVISGALPTGLILSSSGSLGGTPTAAGAYNFTIRATAANGCTGTRAYSIGVSSPPTITPVTTIGLPLGSISAGANNTIANISDPDQPLNTLAVTVNGGPSATLNGVTVSGISVNGAGVVTANLVLTCAATSASFTLTVTDNTGLSASTTLDVGPRTNIAPFLSYNNQSVAPGGSLTINPAGGPTDNGSIASIVVQNQSTYTGTISVNNSTGVVSVSNAQPTGSHTITIRVTDNCNATTDATFTLVVTGTVPTLGIYPNASVTAGGDITISPVGAPSNTVSITASASTNFKGTLAANPTTGVVTVTNAHVAGIYAVLVTAFNSSGGSTTKSFTLTVNNPTNCSPASPVFSQPAGSPVGVGSNPHSVAVGDFNGDGKQDLATANSQSNNVTILLGTGNGGFISAGSVGVGAGPKAVVVGDFNGDGKQDLVVLNGSSDLTILLGDGSGGFVPAASSPISVVNSNGPTSVARGDFNGDGRQDLAVTSGAGPDNVTILLGDGSGGFSQAAGSPVSVGASPQSVVVGDFNNDGKPDLVVANASNNVTILLGNGLGGFTQAAGSPVGAGSNPRSVVIGDFNGDGKQDLAVANAGSNNVTILLGNGSGGFSPAAGSPVGVGTQPQSVAVGDFNGDGQQDLAVTNTFSNNVTILLGNGGGGFSPSPGSPAGVGTQPYSVAVGDFNGDGKQDFAVANNNSSNATILLNNCAPAISVVDVNRQEGSPVSNSIIANVSDADQSAVTLAVSVNGGASATVNGVTVSGISVSAAGVVTANVFAPCGSGNATFTLSVTDSANVTTTATLTVIVIINPAPTLGYNNQLVAPGGSLTISPVTGPADNGGVTSIVKQSQGTYTGTISVNNSTGVVSLSNAMPNGTHTITIRATDNCGAITDATFTLTVGLFVPTLGNYPNATITTGGNTTVMPFATPVNAASITAATSTNFKGTLTVNPTTGVVTVTNAHMAGIYSVTVTAFNTGGTATKTFALTVNNPNACASGNRFVSSPISGMNEPYSVAVSDFNGDGLQDLAVTNRASNNVVILMGTGNGNFNQLSPISVGMAPRSIAASDFNGDGKQDLAVVNNTSNNVTILLGTGDGGFIPAIGSPVSVGNFPIFVSAGDFNGDGKQDLAVANNLSNNVTILLGNGGGGFSEPAGSPAPVGTAPVKMAVGDFNGDGKQDLAVTNAGSANVTILLGNGSGGFSAGSPIGVGNNPQAVVIGDFNGDGIQDLAVANNSDSNVTILLGNGSAGFNPASGSPISVGTDPASLAVGDFNADGKQDLAVANADSANITVLLGNGSSGFSQAAGSPVSIGPNPVFVMVGDFNGDGRQDLAAAKIGSNELAILLANCAPTISASAPLSRQQGSAGTVSTIATVSDAETAAGSLTVAATTVPAGLTVTGITNTNGTITANVTAACNATVGANTVVLTVTDGNGLMSTANLTVNVTANSPPALTYANQSVTVGNALTINPATGPSDNGSVSTIVVQSVTPSLLTGTITVNSTTGVVSVSNNVDTEIYTVTIRATDNCGATTDAVFTLTVAFAIFPTLGNYANASVITGGNTTITPSAAPVNAVSITATTSTNFKGTLAVNPTTGAVTVTNAQSAGSYTVTLNAFSSDGSTATKTFTLTVNNPANCSSGSSGFSPSLSSPVSVGSNPASEAVGDFDGDGLQDLAVANSGSNSVTILLGNGSGGFSPAVNSPISVGSQPRSVAVGDFNGDGKPDLAVANSGSNSVTILLGNGSGGFTLAAGLSFAVTSTPYSVAIGDFNGDGTQDLVVANSGFSNLTVCLGDGSGRFTQQAAVSVGSGPSFVVVGDFNGDGKSDLAVANHGSNNVTILLGNGSGGLSQAAGSPFSVGSGPIAVAVGNFNGDGFQDLAVTNEMDNNVTILLGNGSGSFSPAAGSPVSVGTRPQSVAVGDFNGDGQSDLAVTNAISNNVTILQGNGSGSFSPASGSPVGVGTEPHSLVVGDFNGDGKQDLAVANLASNNATILLGNCAPSITVGAPLTQRQGSVGATSTIATVSDVETAAGNLMVTATTSLPVSILVIGLNNNNGAITANVAALCNATVGANTVVLTVTDGNGLMTTANLTVNVMANAGPTLTYANQTVAPNGSLTVNPATGPSDNGSVANIAVQSQGTYTGTISVNNATGVVSISNAAPAGNHTITIRATDNCGVTTDATFNINVGCQTITLSPAPLPSGQLGQPYSQQLSASGGTTPYTFTISAGALPNGVTLSSAGLLSGTPTQASTFNFTVNAADASGCIGTQAYTVIISTCPTITVNPASPLPASTSFTFYSQQLGASGGASPYNFTVSAGALPAGLTLTTGGLLSGAPTAAGNFNFTVRATDVNSCFGERPYALTITDNPGLMFYPLPAPVRALETRAGFGGCTTPGTPITAGGTFTLAVRGACTGIPANAAAVTGNITVVPSAGGFLTLFPSSATQPTVANSNFKAGEITNNVFTVGMGAGDGAFKIFASATTEVIVDLTGYYAPPAAGGLYFHPLATPVRLLETRTGFNGCFAPGTQLMGTGNPNADPNLDLALQGRSPIPSPCNSIPATAQVLVGNATSVLPSGGGYLTIYPSGGTRPTVASSNYAGSDVINGPFAVKLGADGKFKVYTFSTTHLVIDILGYYSEDATDANGAGLLFNPLPSPVRLLETRPDFPGFPLTGCTRTNAPIQGNLTTATHTQSAANFCGLPAAAQAVVGNVTVVNSGGAGFLTLFPANLTSAPLVATSNYPAPATFGYNRHYFVGLSPADGKFKVLTQFTTDLILDASGYFAP